MRDVEAGKIDLIAFVKLDRWFRNVAEYYKVQEILDAHNVAWKAIHEDYETQTASGRLKVNVMLAVAQDEADRTSERIKAVFEQKQARGEALSGKTAYGISLVDKKLTPNADAENVKQIFDYYIAIRSIRQTMLYAREITGTPFSYPGMGHMLSNHYYYDLGIVTPEVWKAAQQLRAVNSPRITDGRTYLFSGIIFCAECGGAMGAHCNGQYKQYGYYYCRHQRFDVKCSNRHSISEKKVEQALLSQILEKCEAFNLEIRAKQKRPVDVAALKRKADKLADLYINDLISREKYEADYKAVQAAIQHAETQPRPVDVLRVQDALSTYQGLTDAGKRAFWGRMIKRIEIDRDGVISFELCVTL